MGKGSGKTSLDLNEARDGGVLQSKVEKKEIVGSRVGACPTSAQCPEPSPASDRVHASFV